jgi:hypothetical protein
MLPRNAAYPLRVKTRAKGTDLERAFLVGIALYSAYRKRPRRAVGVKTGLIAYAVPAKHIPPSVMK